MKKTRKMSTRRHSVLLAATSAAALAFVLGSTAAVWAQPTTAKPDPKTFQYRDLTLELANKMTGTYVVAAVGDVLVMEPVGKLTDPKIQQILRDADTTVGNLEGIIINRRNFPDGYGNNYAPKEMAADLAALGFDLMNGATGHAADAGEEGLKSTIKWMDEAGILLAGVGPNLATARMPVFQQTAKGRIGLVGASSGIGRMRMTASDVHGNMGRGSGWGLNPLRLTPWNVVTPEQLQQLKRIRNSIVARRGELEDTVPIPMPKDEPDRVQIFTTRYMAGPKPGEYHYEMNQGDLQANLLAIRNTKEFGHFAIFTMHNHSMRYAFQGMLVDNYPSQFLIDFAHALIDNGADMYFGHGPHSLQGVEIYKGRPIFYGLGSFAQQQIQLEGSQEGSDEIPPGMTPIEADELDVERLRHPISLVGLVATSKYRDGKLVEVRLYPMDLGYDRTRPWSDLGIAQTPSPVLAQDILTKVQKYSEPFGTQITIENGVGVIRVPPEATVPVGQDIRSTFPRDF